MGKKTESGIIGVGIFIILLGVWYYYLHPEPVYEYQFTLRYYTCGFLIFGGIITAIGIRFLVQSFRNPDAVLSPHPYAGFEPPKQPDELSDYVLFTTVLFWVVLFSLFYVPIVGFTLFVFVLPVLIGIGIFAGIRRFVKSGNRNGIYYAAIMGTLLIIWSSMIYMLANCL